MSPELRVENAYFEGKDSDGSIYDIFEGVLRLEKELMEGELTKWGFKANKRVAKEAVRREDWPRLEASLAAMLPYVRSQAMTLNEAERALHSLLEFARDAPNIAQLYEAVLGLLGDVRAPRARTRLLLRLANVLLAREAYDDLRTTLKELRSEMEEGAEGPGSGGASVMATQSQSQALEVYALEIQLYTATGEISLLKPTYQQALQVKAAIPAPRIVAVVHECGGKMWFREKAWQAAYDAFFEAFRNYDEAGSARRVDCLKYLVIASLLMGSDIDPFEETRAKSHKDDPEIAVMLSLLDAVGAANLGALEEVLTSAAGRRLLSDPFVADVMDDLLLRVRTAVLLRTVRPYRRVRLSHVSSAIHTNAVPLLTRLILDGTLQGALDLEAGVLELTQHTPFSEAAAHHDEALVAWADTLRRAASSLATRARFM
jgi:COP9 signalosome complex subunit 2